MVFEGVVTEPSPTFLSSTLKVAVSMVVVVPFTVRLPLNVPSTAVTFPDADTFTPLTFPVAARLPVTLAPVDIACTFTSLPDLIALESIPVSAEPSPIKLVAVTTPVALIPPGNPTGPTPSFALILFTLI